MNAHKRAPPHQQRFIIKGSVSQSGKLTSFPDISSPPLLSYSINFSLEKSRIKECTPYLERQPVTDIPTVCHGIFLIFLLFLEKLGAYTHKTPYTQYRCYCYLHIWIFKISGKQFTRWHRTYFKDIRFYT